MFSSNFLTDLARKYELSPEQEEVFLLWWGNGKDDREISEKLHVTVEAIRNRKTGIYKKFSIAGASAKAIKLRNWLEIEAKKQNINADIPPESDDLDLLAQEVKYKIAADVIERCGKMRVLDMTQPIDLDRIYTDVNILKDLTGRQRIGYEDLIDVCTREHFDRFLVGTIQKRVTGFAAVNEFQKLVVLGKPGAGKTTFMKYLAMSCLRGKFHGGLVPIFVTLKLYAEADNAPTLLEYIFSDLIQRKVDRDDVERLLENGKALILLDGLDEVKKDDDHRVKRRIDEFSRDWHKNRFIITCRIAAREYQFENFTEVEVSDFGDQQIEMFVNNWFWEKDREKTKRLLEKLEDNKPVKELAKSPLLLTLLCLVFEERNDFPPKRSELYKEGLEVLMKKWDAKRSIEREQIYKLLSPQNKEDMLGQIAFNTFVNAEYFFRQEDLQSQIKDYICNLPEASADPNALQLDSEVVLKAIEHHHGLLVERARNIYSFSHLTFQEYFTARGIERERQLKILVKFITDPRWKEIFLLTSEMLRQSDDFLQLIKEKIDKMLLGDEALQAFLCWAKQKADSVQTKYKTFAVRAYYAYVGFYDSKRTLDCALDLARIIDIDLDRDLDLDRALALERDQALETALERSIDLVHDRSLDCDLAIAIGIDINRSLNRVIDRSFDLNRSLDIGNDILLQVLQILKEKLPNPKDNNYEAFSKWWWTNGEEWSRELHQVWTDRRYISHNWQFTDEQVELLKQYYAANLLLVECMNRSYVSKQVREAIESTMLLPRKK